MEEILKRNQDLAYKDFSKRLIPNLTKEMIGVRAPVLREIAKDLYNGKQDSYKDFLKDLPHRYHEEDMIHGYLLERIKDFDEAIDYLDKFIPYISNWAVCDSFTIKKMKKYPDKSLEKIREWIEMDHEYGVRFALVCLIKHFTKENFSLEINDMVAGIDREEYYIQIAQGWYFQKALADQREASLIYFDEILKGNVKKYAIQKSIDSYKISSEDKMYLRSLRKA